MAKNERQTSISFNGIGVCVTPEEDVTTSMSQKAPTGKRGVVAVVTAAQIRRERYFELMAGQPFGSHVFTREKK